MDQDEPSTGRRKVKFAPKAPPRRKPKPALPKTEVADSDAEAAEAQNLLRRFNEHLGKQGPKVEKKSSVQVAFGFGATSSTSIKTYGVPSSGNSGKIRSSELKESNSGNGQIVPFSPSTVEPDGTIAGSADAADASVKMIKKEYKEPWDYHHSYYPTALPLRRPYSGDPELLNEAEFGEASTNLEYDENTVNPALDLGLLEESENVEMFFLRLPDNLPLVKRSASAKGQEMAESSISSGSVSASTKGKDIAGSSIPSGGIGVSAKGKEKAGSSPISLGSVGASKKGCSFKELSGGYMGKMLVYKSGAIKLKLGETLYDVSPGSDCVFAQEVVAINTEDKHCCALGELGKRIVVTPDVDSLLNAVNN
ncbi:hypothetical protein L1049_020549 [Liquidambar formosana]|uniref:DNA-directed RNA polymerase III subunit RPC4 n=1 Tax=Liquidambar formosana TaxID=63359 RepID=A0AAP0S825_LIQFO